jgi:hypothetical protein
MEMLAWSPFESGAVIGGLKGADAPYAKLSEKFGYSIPVPAIC